jgi:hypothetical protein
MLQNTVTEQVSEYETSDKEKLESKNEMTIIQIR